MIRFRPGGVPVLVLEPPALTGTDDETEPLEFPLVVGASDGVRSGQ